MLSGRKKSCYFKRNNIHEIDYKDTKLLNKFINDPFWKDRYTSDVIDSYKIENIIKDGAFLDLDKLSLIMRRLKEKKNLILQGPPGTGKTWLAKRLGMALIEEDIKDKQKTTGLTDGQKFAKFVLFGMAMHSGIVAFFP